MTPSTYETIALLLCEVINNTEDKDYLKELYKALKECRKLVNVKIK